MLSVGDRVRVNVTIGHGECERTGKVSYIHPSNRWFLVEIRGKIGRYRECYMMPSENAPKRRDGRADARFGGIIG